MLTTGLRVLLVFLVFSVPAHAADIQTDSDIISATVFTNRATLTREAKVDIPAGASTVIFTDLPAQIMTDSLRAKGSAVASVTFGALSHKRVVTSGLSVPREQELSDKIETLEDKKKVIRAEKDALQAKKNFVSQLGKHAADRSNEEIEELDLKPSSWKEAMDVIKDSHEEVNKAQIALDIQLRDLDEEINKLRRELNESRTGQRSTYQVSLPLETDKATTLTVQLSYQVPGASWRPLYDARLNTETAALDIIQYGSVRQNTGEDWTDISLTLSTAQPHRGAGLPDLQPMWVNVWDTQAARGGGFMQKSREVMSSRALPQANVMGLAEADMVEAEMAPQAAQFSGAQIETGGFVSEYRIPGPSTVPSDGTESKLLVGRFDTDSVLQVMVKPQISTDAYLVARAELKGEAPILPGMVNLFRDGAYVGKTQFPLLRPSEEQVLSFGIDDQVSVKRNLLKDEHSEGGLISKDHMREKHFVTEIQNLHNQQVQVVVLETTPVARDEKLKVEILPEHTTPGYERDADNVKGLLRWVLDMPSKVKKTVKLGWKVTWPKDHNISGL